MPNIVVRFMNWINSLSFFWNSAENVTNKAGKALESIKSNDEEQPEEIDADILDGY